MANRTQKFETRQKMSKKTFEVFHYRDAKAQTVNIHHHDFYEIYYFLGGDVSYLIEGKKYKLNIGDILLINPLQLHQPITNAGAVYERVVLWIDRGYLASLGDENTDFCAFFQDAGKNDVNILHTNIINQGRIADLLGYLNRETHSEDFGHDRYAEGVLLQLLCEIKRMIPNRSATQMPVSIDPPSLVNRITSYINNHYNEDISLDSLAKKYFVSKYYLSHEFSEQIGIGVYKYLTLKRLSIAKELLADGVSAGEVARKCGFHNYPTFYRIFKSEYGISPSNFKNE